MIKIIMLISFFLLGWWNLKAVIADKSLNELRKLNKIWGKFDSKLFTVKEILTEINKNEWKYHKDKVKTLKIICEKEL